MSALAFVHPGGRPSHLKQCCAPNPTPENAEHPKDQHIRVYHAEPSDHSYNHGCYVIRESRYSTQQGWHAPKVDDLVADDAAAGSSVCAIGWWVEEQTRVYYIDKTGQLRERFNQTSFTPKMKDDFERELPNPAKMVPPNPGWSQTTLLAPGAHPTGPDNLNYFPTISPLLHGKIAATRSENGNIHVFYQASDSTIHNVVNHPGKGWTTDEGLIIGAGKVKPGAPLTAIAGGWDELRLFYATTGEMLAGVYRDDRCGWAPIVEIPACKLLPSAMLSAVAWNYASAYFEMRIFTTDDKNDLYEYHFDRSQGGWAQTPRSVSTIPSEAISPTKGSGTPLSAVAAVVVEDQWKTKVYFHPRRQIAEWDVCSKATAYNGIPKMSEGAAHRRQIEEETRARIKEGGKHAQEDKLKHEAEEKKKHEAEEKKKHEAELKKKHDGEEAKKKHDAEEAKKTHDAGEAKKRHDAEEAKKKHDAEEAKKKHDAEEAKKKHLPNTVKLKHPIALMGGLDGKHQNIDDVFHKIDLPFAITLYGHASKTVWVTDNGMMCLDSHTDARAHRFGMALPAHQGIPPYAVFPYWTDLMISAGKPHGIYYEIDGPAGKRQLTVEWYVTRYKHEEQYFHFTVELSEAHPNVVTFKYYDVGDKTHESTVGVQGPKAHMQYSHNQANVHKGLQVVFNTHENKMHHSTHT